MHTMRSSKDTRRRPARPEEDDGDSHRFRRLFEAHAEALRRYARRFVRSRETAEDLVQEVFFRVWRGWDTLDTGTGIRAYLYLATRSRALSHLEREQREAHACTLAFSRGSERGSERGRVRGIVADEPALPPEAETNLETDDLTRAIEQVLAMMPPRQREVAALRLRHQMPTAAIALKLGISPRTVEVHIARATKTLREQLPPLLQDERRRPPSR